jgi:hypothetical protein
MKKEPSPTHTAINLPAITNSQIKGLEASYCNILRPHYTSIPVALEEKELPIFELHDCHQYNITELTSVSFSCLAHIGPSH